MAVSPGFDKQSSFDSTRSYDYSSSSDSESTSSYDGSDSEAKGTHTGWAWKGVTRLASFIRGKEIDPEQAERTRTIKKIDDLRKKYFDATEQYLQARPRDVQKKLSLPRLRAMKEYVDAVTDNLDKEFFGREYDEEKQKALKEELSRISKDPRFKSRIWFSKREGEALVSVIKSQFMVYSILSYLAKKGRPDFINIDMCSAQEGERAPLISPDFMQILTERRQEAVLAVERKEEDEIYQAAEEVYQKLIRSPSEEDERLAALLTSLGSNIAMDPALVYAGCSYRAAEAISRRVHDMELPEQQIKEILACFCRALHELSTLGEGLNLKNSEVRNEILVKLYTRLAEIQQQLPESMRKIAKFRRIEEANGSLSAAQNSEFKSERSKSYRLSEEERKVSHQIEILKQIEKFMIKIDGYRLIFPNEIDRIEKDVRREVEAALNAPLPSRSCCSLACKILVPLVVCVAAVGAIGIGRIFSADQSE